MISFTSALAPEHRDELERLLFFNANQARVSDGVSFVAKRFGIPRVNVVGERLRVEVASRICTQSLFVVDKRRRADRPIGVIVYTRERGTLVVLFVAVHEEYAAGGTHADQGLLVRIVAQMRRIAKRIRGVERLRVYVGQREPMELRVRRPASDA